jgi:hypothetical protein
LYAPRCDVRVGRGSFHLLVSDLLEHFSEMSASRGPCPWGAPVNSARVSVSRDSGRTCRSGPQRRDRSAECAAQLGLRPVSVHSVVPETLQLLQLRRAVVSRRRDARDEAKRPRRKGGVRKPGEGPQAAARPHTRSHVSAENHRRGTRLCHVAVFLKLCRTRTPYAAVSRARAAARTGTRP